MSKKHLKTLVIGNQGYIGKSFFDFYKTIDPNTIGTHYQNAKYCIDLLNPDITNLPIRANEYSWVLIAAGNAKIASCESNKNLSYKCNVEGILSLIKQFLKLDIKPIIISTDYVFDGLKGKYKEEDLINPLNEYGRQRVELEKEAEKICKGQCLILRLSKTFSINQNDKTFLNEIACSILQGERIRAAEDQIFTPVLMDDFIIATIELQKQNASGIFHICGKDTISRYDVVQKMIQALDVNKRVIERISLELLNESFIRPKDTSMDCSKLIKTIGFQPKSINYCINEVAKNFSIQNI